jgi:hypothetical protein
VNPDSAVSADGRTVADPSPLVLGASVVVKGWSVSP